MEGPLNTSSSQFSVSSVQWGGPFFLLVTAVMFSIAYMTTAYVNKHNNINDVAWTTAVHLIGIVIIVVLLPFRLPHGLTKDVGAKVFSIMTDPISLAVVIALGATMFGSEVCLFNSIKSAPNPGLSYY